MLGISTSWWGKKGCRGDAIALEAMELGFRGIELEYRLSQEQYRQMAPFLKTDISVLSVHNFFPRHEAHRGGRDLFLLSSTDEKERLTAVRRTITTIEHARELGARVVVLHLGRVDIASPTDEWIRLACDDNSIVQKREAFFAVQQQRRKEKQKDNLDAVLASLEILNRTAQEKGVLLGIENRFHFHEIPDFEEIGRILDTFEGENIGYWHDTGHAHALEQLGVGRQNDLLDAYGDRLLGIHLHDAVGFDDHQPPGCGEIDFAQVLSFLRPTVIKILEIHSGVPKKNLVSGIETLESHGVFQDAADP